MSEKLPLPNLDEAVDESGRFTAGFERLSRNALRLAATGLAIAAGMLPLVGIAEGANAESAAAATLGYPDYDMPCEHYPYAESGYCPDYDWGPVRTSAYSDPSELSARGYAYRNCTDYVAWKESTRGVAIPRSLGNAGDWFGNAPATDRSLTPAAGDVAISPSTASNPFGHVAFIESVNPGGTITVSEYNHDAEGGGDVRSGIASSMGFTEFLDFGARPEGATQSSGTADTAASAPPQLFAPDVAYNPSNGLPVVAAEGTDGTLQYHYQKSDGSWGTADLGVVASDTSLAYNPVNGLPVVAVEGSDHGLDYHYQEPGGDWGVARLGEADSAPDVAYNPGNHLPVTVVQGAGRALIYYYQKSDGSWGHAGLGTTASAPSVAYNPASRLPVVAAEGTGGTLDYHYQRPDGSWGIAHLGNAVSRPDVKYNPYNHLPAIAVQGPGNVLVYHYQKSDGSWGEVDLGEADSAPRLAYNPRSGLPTVAVRSGSILDYHYQKSDGSWGAADLGTAISTPGMAYNPTNGLPVVAAETSDGALGYHYQQSDGSWGFAGL